MRTTRSIFFLVPLALFLGMWVRCGVLRAENEGLDDLDKATEAKLSSRGPAELTKVIQLLDSALEKGLDKDNSEFAEQLLVASLVERATMIASLVLDRPVPHPRWPEFREKALEDLRRALDIDDQQSQGHLLVGRLLSLPLGDREEAIQSFNKVIENEAADLKTKAKAYIYRGNIQTDEKAGLADFNRAVELLPEDTDILRTRAMYFLRLNRFTDALADLDKALEIDPKHAPTHEIRGLALMMMKQFDEALAAFDRAAELIPESSSPQQNRARVLALQGQLDNALAAVDKAIELDPKAISAWMLRCQLLIAQGKIDEAMKAIDEVLTLRPKWDQAVRVKAEILAGTGRIDEAIKCLEEVAQEGQKNTEIQIQLAMYYMVQKRSRDAIVLYTEVLRREADNLRALRNRADAYLNIGKHSEAIADYEKANQLKSDDSGVLNNFAWVLATSPFDQLRNGQRAIELATKACELTDFQAAHILSTRAAAHAETGDFEAAIQWATKAIEVNRAEQDDDGNPLDPEELEHLENELKSYQEKKPWRELLEEEPTPKSEENTPSEDAPARTIDF
ncbi:MAG: tetratricopeptide repeat protein [Pirellulales bacterium]|nr:tetratricopeptide repeat protein [Pirellulales bacterium]